MAEEEKQETSEETKAKSTLKPVIMVALVVFMGATAGFAWLEGLFGPAPTPPETAQEAQADTALTEEPAEISPETQTLAQAARQTPLGQTVQAAATAQSATRAQNDEEEWLRNEKQLLTEKQRELDKREKELESLKRELDGLLTKIQETKSERIVMMAKLYDSMDPESVANQLSNMDVRTVVMILPQMNTRTAAKVMGLLDPKHAAQITTKMLALDQ